MLIYLIFIVWTGLLIGSFLNNVIFRTRSKEGFISGRSKCPHCGHQLAPLELIPVLSWIALRGHCRKCKQPISWQYPLVEALTGLVFALAFITHRPHDLFSIIVLILWLHILSSFIVLAVYDLRWYLLPDKILLPIIAPASALLLMETSRAHSLQVAGGAILAALTFGGVFYAMAELSKGRWMGGGDIKLAFIMGLLLGLQKTLLAMFIAFNSAALIGIGLIAVKRKGRGSHIPF